MGFMDKILDVMKLDPDDDYDYESDDLDEVETTPSISKRMIDDEDDRRKSTPKASKPVSKITPMRSIKSKGNNSPEMEVCVVKPTAIEDEREITDSLLEGRTVVLNVEGLAVDIAQRIIDFVSGSCYAMDGNLQKISNYIFIITPASVDISGDFQAYVDTFDVNSFKSEF